MNNDTFTDPRDCQVYHTIELNGQLWMSENLNYDVGEGCWFYDNDPKNGEKYGRLYTWEAAQRACPPGWRIPTIEEWQSIVRVVDVKNDPYELLGGNPDDYNEMIHLLKLTLGGSRRWIEFGKSHMGYVDINFHGDYWSTTEFDEEAMSTLLMDARFPRVCKYFALKNLGISLRLIK